MAWLKRLRKNSGIFEKLDESKPQGLKPIDLIELIGTTEVVPFYKAFSMEFFRSL